MHKYPYIQSFYYLKEGASSFVSTFFSSEEHAIIEAATAMKTSDLLYSFICYDVFLML